MEFFWNNIQKRVHERQSIRCTRRRWPGCRISTLFYIERSSMNLTDIIELAKQGYKPSDIKELIALSKDNDSTEDKPEDKTEDKPEDKPEDKTEDKPEDKPEDKSEDNPEDKSEDKTEDNKDKIIEELRKKLQNENLSGEDKIKTSTEILNNLLKDM